MRFGYTILYVKSVEDAVAFYERAFGLRRRMVTDAGEYGEMETGSTTLAFAAAAFVPDLAGVPFEAAAPERAAPPLEIALVTDDVEAAFERATAAGAVALKPPARKPWGQLVAYLRDPDGFLVELCSPLGD